MNRDDEPYRSPSKWSLAELEADNDRIRKRHPDWKETQICLYWLAYRRGEASMRERAAKWIAKRRDAYHEAHGFYDGSTGAWEYPGDGAEYMGELDEIEEAIRALPDTAEGGE